MQLSMGLQRSTRTQHDSVSTLSRVRTIVDALGLVRVTVQDMPLG